MEVLNSFYLSHEDVSDIFNKYLKDNDCEGLLEEVGYVEFENVFREWIQTMEAERLILWSPSDQCYYVHKSTLEL